jgi:hypothetical protein
MKMKYILPRVAAILVIIVAFASCEEEFSTIDTDIIDQGFNTDFDDTKSVVAYSKAMNGVQTNDLIAYKLGVYNDPTYGKSTVSLLSQLQMIPSDLDPSFGNCVEVDSVVLYFPFYSRATTADEVTTYEVDSIYGNNPVNIKIFESNFLLNNLDPSTGFTEAQRYYSNEKETFESNLGELLLEINDFTATNEAIVVNDTVSLAPGLRVELPVEFFKEQFIDFEGQPELLNNSNFKEHLRGLYFQVESATDDGNLFIFDLEDVDDQQIGITVFTSFKDLEDGQTCETAGVEVQNEETRLFFNAINVNVYDNEVPAEITAALENPNTIEGEESLYLRGGDGIATIIDLFGADDDGNGVADELEILRDQDWLINEANLIFYVDQDKVLGGDTEPERIIIFDAVSDRPLVDYGQDLTNNTEAVDAVTDHLGRLERGSDENGDFYKIRITTHVSNLINKDSTNVPLGLTVSHNIGQIGFTEVEIPLLPTEFMVVPKASIMSPEGTVLHGNRSLNESKKLKLQIFYTKPD